MTDNINEDNVYSRGVRPWHLKGIVGMVDETCKQVLSRMTPVEFEKREFSIILNGESVGNKYCP
jgi:hypothetical protein